MKAFATFRLKWFALLCLLGLLAACGPATPTAGTGRGFAYVWYVSLSGDDGNTCAYTDDACLTLAGALSKAVAENERLAGEYPDLYTVDHTINVAAGTYRLSSSSTHFASVTINATIVGAGEDSTIFDADDTHGGISVNGDVRVRLRNFTVRNVGGSSSNSCINIIGDAQAEIENVTVAHCLRYGINHVSHGPLSLINVTATDNLLDSARNGGGVISGGVIEIQGGEFSHNEGEGLVINGALTMDGSQIDHNQRDGLYVQGSANLDHVQVSDNGLDGTTRAGIAVIGGSVTAANSTITNNQLGVWVTEAGSSLAMIDSQVVGNPRTGISVADGEISLTNTTVEDNADFYAGTSYGGGLEIGPGVRATLTNSQISANHNGGIYNFGQLFIRESSIIGNDGSLPAIYNDYRGNAQIDHSLIANNSFSGRIGTTESAVENRGSMTVSNTTISSNQGFGISTSSSLTVSYSTIVFNSIYGLLPTEHASEAPTLSNDIIAGNGMDCYTPGPSGPGPSTLTGHNIDGDGSCHFPETAALADLVSSELADNGGPTLTHALLPGSPAIDAATGSCPTDDQRLAARPFGPACDAGAYESGGIALSLETDLDLATATPTSELPTLTTTVKTGCFFGPGEAWLRLDTLAANTQAEVVGQGFGGGWLVVKHPTKGLNCWINQNDVRFDFPLDQLRLIAVPAKPTPTPSPTSPPRNPTPKPTECFYNAQNQYICQ